jgi:hypothetical protein
MKLLKTIAFVLMAGLIIINASCKKDTQTSDMALTVSQDRVIAHLGDTIPLTIDALTSNDDIKSITVSKTGGTKVTVPVITNSKNYSTIVNYIVTDSVGTLVFTIDAEGSNSNVTIEKTLTFSIVKDIEVTLGTSTSIFPNFINGSSLTTYNATNAFANQGSVDLVYSYSAADGVIIGSPSDPIFDLTTWTTKNNSKIGLIMDETPDAVSMVTGTSVKNLAKDDMLGYVTATGVKGIVEVMDITPGPDGNVLFTFMVIK